MLVAGHAVTDGVGDHGCDGLFPCFFPILLWIQSTEEFIRSMAVGRKMVGNVGVGHCYLCLCAGLGGCFSARF